jgi:L-aspartate oxidase
VFSYRAAMKIKSKRPRNFSKVVIPDWDESGTANQDDWYLIKHNFRQIQHLMWDYVGIVRSQQTLERAYRRMRMIVDETENYYRRNKLNLELIELRNLSIVALIIISSALRRHESRGCHHMSDFPDRDDKYLKNTII